MRRSIKAAVALVLSDLHAAAASPPSSPSPPHHSHTHQPITGPGSSRSQNDRCVQQPTGGGGSYEQVAGSSICYCYGDGNTSPLSDTYTHTHTLSAELFDLSATPHSLLSTDHEGTYVNILPEMSHFIPSSVKRLHKSINVLWGILTWAALLPGRELKLHTSVLCFSKCQ